MKLFKVSAWVHHDGGDDEPIKFRVKALDRKKARVKIEARLKRAGSALLTDYRIEGVTPA